MTEQGSSDPLMMIEVSYDVYGENFAGTTQRTIFNDTVSRILENISLETHSSIYMLAASKAPTACSDTARQGLTEVLVEKLQCSIIFVK